MNEKQKRIIHTICKVAFVVYLIVLTYFLFFSERYGRTNHSNYGVNLKLFKEISRFVRYQKEIGFEGVVVNLLGNILAFTPFGFGLPVISPRNRKFINILLLSFQFSLTIEIIQLILHVGIFDVDDLLLNTIGGIIGYMGYIVVHNIIRRINNEYKRKK